MMYQHFNTVLEHLKSVSLRKGRSTPEPEDTNNSLATSSAEVETTTRTTAPKEKSNFFKFQSALLPSLTSSIIPMSTTGSSTTTSSTAAKSTSIDEPDKCVRPDKGDVGEDEFVVNGGGGSGSNSSKNSKTILPKQQVNSSSISNCNPSICSKCSNKIDTFDQQIFRKRASICVPNGDYRIRNNNISPLGIPNTKSKTSSMTSSEISSVVGTTTLLNRTASPSGTPKKNVVSQNRSRTGSVINLDEEGRPILVRKPIKVKNVATGAEAYDSLYCKGREVSYLLLPIFLDSLITF